MAVGAVIGIGLLAATAAIAGSAGDLDPSFGNHGLRIVHNPKDPSEAVAVGRKGRIVVAGGETVARLQPNGMLDRSFADGGIARLQTPPWASYGLSYTSLAVSREGGVFVAGEYCTLDQATGHDRCGFAVSHLKRDGQVDRAFGHGGTARVQFAYPESWSSSIAIARGGKPVVTGNLCRSYLRDCNLALARLDPDGRLDQSFGDGGKVVTSVGPGGDCPIRQYQLSPMDVDSRGRIVMGAYCGSTVSLARFGPSGHLDRSFGRRGKVNRQVRIGSVTALAIDPKNRIDVAGPRGRPPTDYAVARFRPSGKVDSSFGNNGTAGVRFHRKKRDVYAIPLSAAIDSRGRIVLAGGAFGFSFTRFTAHGHVDRHFGQNGRVVTGFSVGPGSYGQGLRAATSVAIDRRDRIVASGLQRNNGEDHFAVVRLLG